MDAEDLVESAHAFFEERGIECSVRYERSPSVRADATFAVRWGGSRQRFAVHATGAVRLGAVLAAVGEAGLPVLVVAPWISPRIGEQLRSLRVAYVDSVGNAWLRFGTVLIEVAGRKRPRREVEPVEVEPGETELVHGGSRQARPPDARPPDARQRAGRLLTPANRRVIAALLADPGLETAPLRELAAAADVSLGQVHKTVTLLAAAGYRRDHLGEEQRAALVGVLEAVRLLDR